MSFSKVFSRRNYPWFGVLLLAGLLLGCSSSEDRQAKYYKRAQELMEQGDYAKAKLEVRNVLQINENHVEARYLWALLFEREQNYRQMFANLQLAVDLDPHYVEARIKLGQTFYRAQQYDRAMEQAEASLELEPENPDALTLVGSVRFREGDNDGAVEAAQRAMLAKPGHVGAISIITEVYKQQDPERALAVIGDGIAQQSEDETLKLLEITVYKAQGDDDAVIAGYESLMQDNPENLFYHYQLIKYLEQNERIDEAEVVLRNIVKTKPENTQLKLWLAEFLANQRNLQLAESTVKDFIEREPGLYELRFALGKIYEALGDMAGANQVYNEIIAIDVEGADSVVARNRKIDIAMRALELEVARGLIRNVLVIEPQNSDALMTRARIQLGTAEYETAVASLRTVVKNEPENVDAWVLLGQANTLRGAEELALDNFKSALSIDPASQAALEGVFPLLFAAGEVDLANGYLESAIKRKGVNPVLRNARFEAALQQGDYTSAERLVSWFQEYSSVAYSDYLIGRIYASKGAYVEARAAFQRASEASFDPRFLNALASTFKTLGELNEAEALFTGYASTHVKNTDITTSLGVINLWLGNKLRAQELLHSAVRSNGNIQAYRRLMTMMLEDGQLDQALEITRALKTAKQSSSSYLLMAAQVYERAGLIEDAKRAYWRLLYLSPTSVLGANNLAMLLLNSTSDEAVSTAMSLTTRFSSSQRPALLDTRGRALLASGQPQLALRAFESALEYGGADFIDAEILAAAKAMIEDSDEA